MTSFVIVACLFLTRNFAQQATGTSYTLHEVGGNHAQSVGFSTDGFTTTATAIMRKLHLIWVMMNEDTRRMHKVSDDVKGEYLVFFPRTLRLAFLEENNNSLKKIAKLEDLAEYSRLGLVVIYKLYSCGDYTYTILYFNRRSDLDMNKHASNVTYINWMGS
ncbi:unnamed protein product [Lactuca virosa]|uniref:Acyl-ACP thioesterase-like C-terminal domain-containing protein n=1 Tax=Lactuca virosa TaxID=75947 RepID=A0AAU9M0F2_9ASTR|nr:unnamed protein product [Lactuca virosa]